MKKREEHAIKLREIADYAFAYGTDAIGKDKFEVHPNKWTPELKTDFLIKCHDGFKIAQKLLLEEIVYYQTLHKTNASDLKDARRNRNKEKVAEFITLEKTIQHRLQTLSHIADGIAWQLLQGQIHIARRFHIGQNTSKFLEDSNISHAIRVADDINKDPLSFCLISDLTSFVQIGDLLIKRNGSTGIMELKEGKVNEQIEAFLNELEEKENLTADDLDAKFDKNTQKQMERMLKQKERASNALEVINEDTGTDPRTGADIHIGTPTAITEYYHEDLYELHEKLKSKNWSYIVVDECLHIGMYKGPGLLMAKDTIKDILKQETENFVLIDFLSITENLSAPLFAKPFDRSFIIDVLIGNVKVIIGLDMDKLIEIFSRYGLEAKWLSKKESMKIKQNKPNLGVVFIKDRAISLTMPNGNQGIMSGGILSKILYDSITPSSMATTILTSTRADKT